MELYYDKEIMFHRFCKENINKNIGTLCKELDLTKKEYEDAVIRAMKQEAEEMRA